MTHPIDALISSVLRALGDPVFWVTLLCGAMILYTFFRGFFSQRSNLRMDLLDHRIEQVEKEMTAMNTDIEEMRNRNPLLWRVK